MFCIEMFNYLNEVQKKEFQPICTSHSNAAHNKPTKAPYRGVDKSLARPGKKQATATEDFEFHISYL